MILDSIRQPEGDAMWVIAILSQSVEQDTLRVTTDFEIYAVAATLQAANDIVWKVGPHIPRDRFLAMQILEAPLVDG